MKASLVSKRVGVSAIVLALGLGLVIGRRSGQGSPHEPIAAVAAPSPASSQPDKRYMVPVSSSQPTVGPSDARVTIVEWCDLPDPRCATLDPTLKALRAEHPDDIRWVFRHFAHSSQVAAMRPHMFAREAYMQAGKFWEARALLLDPKLPIDDAQLEQDAKQLGLDWQVVRAQLDKTAAAGSVTADRLFADMFDVHDSPALFVNGRSLGEHPDAQSLKRIVDEELASTATLVAGGVAKADVYAELTKHGAWKAPMLAAKPVK